MLNASLVRTPRGGGGSYERGTPVVLNQLLFCRSAFEDIAPLLRKFAELKGVSLPPQASTMEATERQIDGVSSQPSYDFTPSRGVEMT